MNINVDGVNSYPWMSPELKFQTHHYFIWLNNKVKGVNITNYSMIQEGKVHSPRALCFSLHGLTAKQALRLRPYGPTAKLSNLSIGLDEALKSLMLLQSSGTQVHFSAGGALPPWADRCVPFRSPHPCFLLLSVQWCSAVHDTALGPFWHHWNRSFTRYLI